MNSHFIEMTTKLYKETISQTINQLGNSSRDGKIELNEARIENLKSLWNQALHKLLANHDYRPEHLKKLKKDKPEEQKPLYDIEPPKEKKIHLNEDHKQDQLIDIDQDDEDEDQAVFKECSNHSNHEQLQNNNQILIPPKVDLNIDYGVQKTTKPVARDNIFVKIKEQLSLEDESCDSYDSDVQEKIPSSFNWKLIGEKVGQKIPNGAGKSNQLDRIRVQLFLRSQIKCIEQNQKMY